MDGSDWVSVEKIMLAEGERFLCLFNGEPIVLELGLETPTYEEVFKPFYYWFEPYGDAMLPEWHEVTHCILIPKAKEEVNNAYNHSDSKGC